MQQQILSPGMQDGDDANLTSKSLWGCRYFATQVILRTAVANLRITLLLSKPRPSYLGRVSSKSTRAWYVSFTPLSAVPKMCGLLTS